MHVESRCKYRRKLVIETKRGGRRGEERERENIEMNYLFDMLRLLLIKSTFVFTGKPEGYSFLTFSISLCRSFGSPSLVFFLPLVFFFFSHEGHLAYK
jgi:hypothetical protein